MVSVFSVMIVLLSVPDGFRVVARDEVHERFDARLPDAGQQLGLADAALGEREAVGEQPDARLRERRQVRAACAPARGQHPVLHEEDRYGVAALFQSRGYVNKELRVARLEWDARLYENVVCHC